MKEINLPYHLILPIIISIFILGLLIYKKKKMFKNGKWFWISLIVFFTIYLLIVSGATYMDISAQLNLQKFDLNGDGFFNGSEITPDQKAAMKTLTNDTGRNFSFIIGLFLSGIIAFIVLVIGKISQNIKNYKIINKKNI